MRARRGRGESSIYQRKDGRWVGEYAQGYINGKRQRRFVYAKTKAEVDKLLLKLKMDALAGTLVRPIRETVEIYLNGWIKIGATTWAGSTLEAYRITVQKHIIPILGRTLLQQLEPRHIQNFYAVLLERKTGPRTIEMTHAVLIKSLNDAVGLELISRNPAANVKFPKTQQKPRTTLSLDQV